MDQRNESTFCQKQEYVFRQKSTEHHLFLHLEEARRMFSLNKDEETKRESSLQTPTVPPRITTAA